jgi:hypothetical protein
VAGRTERRPPRPGHLLPVQGRPGPRTLRGIDEQVTKAEQAVAGKTPVKRNRFVQLSGGTRTVNRELEEKTRAAPDNVAVTRRFSACRGVRWSRRGVR